MEREKGNNNGNTILLTVIGVATLLVALVGATFAYFSASINNEQAESIDLRTAKVAGLEYDGSTPLNLLNAVPGDKDTQTFTVKNPENVEAGVPNTATQQYDLILVIAENTLSDAYQANNNRVEDPSDAAKLANQLTLTLSGTSTGSNTPVIKIGTSLNLTQGVIATKNGNDWETTTTGAAAPKDKEFPLVQNQHIAPGETHTYTVGLDFANLDIPQDYNQGKDFSATIKIANVSSLRTTD